MRLIPAAISFIAFLTLGALPADALSIFVMGPTSVQVAEGDSAAFTVVVFNTVGDVGFQWEKQAIDLSFDPIEAATAAMFSIPFATPDDAGVYRCVATDDGGPIASDTITLTVVPPTPKFSFTMIVVGQGTTFPPAGSFQYDENLNLFLSALPNAGWSFDRWEGNVTGSNNPTSIVMDSDKTVTAVFVENLPVTLTTSVTGSGTINPAPGTHPYFEGATAILNARPDPGFAFAGWQGDLGGENAYNQTLLMDASKSVTAVFAPADFTLTMNVSGGGLTIPPAGETGFINGQTPTISATPAAMDWSFDHWEGDLTGNANPTMLTMNGNKTVTAVFTSSAADFELTTMASGQGTVDPAGTTTHFPGSDIVITASPAEGWSFSHWSGGLSGSTNPDVLTIIADTTVVAVFTEMVSSFSLTMSVLGQGTVSPEGTTEHEPGTQVELTATPAVGWVFQEWQGGLTGSDNPTMVTMDQNRFVLAVFVELPPRTLTTSVTGNGTVTPAGLTTHPGNSLVTLTATPDPGWTFVQWQGDLSGSENPTMIVMDANKSITAVFAQNTVSLTTQVSGNGTVNPPGTSTQTEFDTVLVTAIPALGWRFARWEGDLSGTSNPAPLNMDADKTVTAVFEQITYTLTVNVTGQGSVNPGGVTQQNAEETVQLTATPAEGWLFFRWLGAVTGMENPEFLLMDGNKTVTAVFIEDTEGEAEAPPMPHSADLDGDGIIGLSEVLRIIQFFNSLLFHCDVETEDGYAPGAGDQSCMPHASDYAPQDWIISFSELLRMIQFYNSGGVFACPEQSTEDGFCPGIA